MEKVLIVSGDSLHLRLDKFLCQKLSSISRTRIVSLITRGAISVGGKARKPSYLLKGGEEVVVKLEDEKSSLKPFAFTVKIIYEDDALIVVDKPGGLVVHPTSAGDNETLINALLHMRRRLSTVSTLRPGVVHRLDKETSGVIIIAKDNFVHLNLVRQFRERKVKKEYRAVCWGRAAKEEFSVDLPLARDKRNRLKMKVSFLKAKNALTEVRLIERLKGAAFLSLKPSTGRMHQIRVHLNFLGLPIVGDKKYGIKDSYRELFLHAYRLGFFHPKSGEFLEFASPLPQRFSDFINKHKL